MVPATSNRLLPLLVGGVVLMLVFVLMKSCTGESGNSVLLDRVPRAPSPDADTPADTIKTLTANVAAMTAEVGALRKDNAALRDANQTILSSRARIEENVATRVKRELLIESRSQDNASHLNSDVLSTLTARVDALSDTFAGVEARASASDIPIGLGYDSVAMTPDTVEQIVWVEPLDVIDLETGQDGLLGRGVQTVDGVIEPMSARGSATEFNAGMEDTQPRPVYTVPRNATLIGSTAMTAMVGRIPVQGEVRDPMPFKIITGADNLAANGLTIPGVQGMVWSGTAIGDWTLSCVTGRLESVTFVFNDGTIRTIPDDGQQTNRTSADGALGWISDAQGVPCITGSRKTNAPTFLAQRIGISAIGAAAEAAAAAETTSVLSNAGSVTDRVTGNTGAFVLGKTVAGGSDEVSRWLLERQSQSFDAVFVPAGTKVAIHVDQALAIDHDPLGRKLSHVTANSDRLHSRLD